MVQIIGEFYNAQVWKRQGTRTWNQLDRRFLLAWSDIDRLYPVACENRPGEAVWKNLARAGRVLMEGSWRGRVKRVGWKENYPKTALALL
jgi:hypothetical protein